MPGLTAFKTPVKHIIQPVNPNVKYLSRLGWIAWLNAQQWTYWATFTTRYELSLPSARHMANVIADHCLDYGDLMFWAAEEFDCRDGYHIHTILRTALERQKLWKWAFRRYGRSHIQDYDYTLGAGDYVSKYISKRMVDYDIIGNNKDRYKMQLVLKQKTKLVGNASIRRRQLISQQYSFSDK